jgi:hypothetical protein
MLRRIDCGVRTFTGKAPGIGVLRRAVKQGPAIVGTRGGRLQAGLVRAGSRTPPSVSSPSPTSMPRRRGRGNDVSATFVSEPRVREVLAVIGRRPFVRRRRLRKQARCPARLEVAPGVFRGKGAGRVGGDLVGRLPGVGLARDRRASLMQALYSGVSGDGSAMAWPPATDSRAKPVRPSEPLQRSTRRSESPPSTRAHALLSRSKGPRLQEGYFHTQATRAAAKGTDTCHPSRSTSVVRTPGTSYEIRSDFHGVGRQAHGASGRRFRQGHGATVFARVMGPGRG